MVEGKIGTVGSVMQSIGSVGPMLNVVGIFAIISAFWRPIWEVVLFAFSISFLTVYTPMKISEKVTSNGGYYSFNGIAGHKSAGVFVSYIYMAYGFLALPAITLFMSGVLISVLPDASGIMFYFIPLIVIFISGMEVFIISRGMGISIRYIEIFGFLEVAFLIFVSFLMIFHADSYFSRSSGPFLGSGFWEGTLFGILMFSGVGSSIFISENTKNSKFLTGRSIIIAYLATGAAMVFASYAVQSFIGPDITGYNGNPFILITLIRSAFGGIFMDIFLFFALMSSANLAVSYLNAFRNSVMSMHRDGIFQRKSFGKKKFSSFYILIFLINGLLTISFYFTLGSFEGFVVMSGCVSLLFLSIHSISNITLTRFSFSRRETTGKIIPPASTVFLAFIMVMYLSGSGLETAITDAFYGTIVLASLMFLAVMKIYRKNQYATINFIENDQRSFD
ncbi:APC family permease [Oxyplasma meridianum]|uniref:APC family permease n=1 Tax=Oxyplasma meridianum TaxID=3073602 RepID=A0AAX4NHP5_9ARCH